MTTIDVLISTCNNRILNLSKMNLAPYSNVRYLIIHQVFEKNINQKEIDYFKAEIAKRKDILIYSVEEKGLSKSRNAAIAKSTADICLISDDDIIYLAEAIPKITNAFEQYTNADVIAFKMINANGQPVREYPGAGHQYITRMTDFHSSTSFWSPEIAFRRESILKAKISFNEHIGAGTSFPIGEETLFLADCYHQHLSIAFSDISICILPNSSTGDREDLSIYFTRGVVHSKIFGVSWLRAQIRKQLIDQCTPHSCLKLIYYLTGCFYYCLMRKSFN